MNFELSVKGTGLVENGLDAGFSGLLCHSDLLADSSIIDIEVTLLIQCRRGRTYQ